MDILKWNKDNQQWEVATPGVDQLDPGYVNPTFDVDVEITKVDKGLILKSVDGTRWRVQVSNSGTLTVTAV